jgi:hypothetical protein
MGSAASPTGVVVAHSWICLESGWFLSYDDRLTH